ncbi:MAG: acireductone dioxygenase [Chroococcidiopsidaceae cyanobacterium CP_BM_ER_R8_30]|nr:acireductone dioxygenase [Chroococcidiopsidaceae cyanobacterium CP_BM_ER_R8_30]
MATLKLDEDTVYTDLQTITHKLSLLKIQINHWPVEVDPQLHRLLAQESLNAEEQTQVLMAFDGYFVQLQQTADYQSRDLIVLHPGVPNLDTLLAKFNRIHTHADDEVRYIIDGEGVFGFVYPDGSQVELTIKAEEYITVPAGTKHWFNLTPQRRIKAIRYFTGTEGWVSHAST